MSKNKNKKGAFDISFGWIFAVIVGAFILFLAIYGVIKFVDIQKNSVSAQSSMSIGILTDPLQTSFESVKRATISVPSETRIYTDCSNSGFFGKQLVRTSEKSYNAWSENGVNTSFQNKYIFSKNPVDGKKFYVFSKPFEFPFKVADLMYLSSITDKYCFINAPVDIQSEIEDLQGQTISPDENLLLVDEKSECPEGSTTICFNGNSNCDVIVSTIYNSVIKGNQKVYYEGDALMYAAIFSDKQDYECQVARLINRTDELFTIYANKSSLLSKETGCNADLSFEFIQMLSLLKGFKNSQDLSVIYGLADDINKKNEYADCKLW